MGKIKDVLTKWEELNRSVERRAKGKRGFSVGFAGKELSLIVLRNRHRSGRPRQSEECLVYSSEEH